MKWLIGIFFLFLTTSLYPVDWSPVRINPQGPNKIGTLYLGKDHPIDQSTLLYVKFSLDHFKKEGVSCVVLRLNTPGGEVFAALKIVELLKDLDKKDHIPVIAYIDNWAISAGAMLAYSCRYIGITEAASMGAAEPVLMGEEGKMESASEKINSALRAEFANLASLWGRNPDIAEAMVDKDIILVLRDGQIMRLDDESQIRLKGSSPDTIVSNKGKLLTLNTEQMEKYGVSDFTASDLEAYPFFGEMHDKEWISYTNWKISFFAFLLHPAVVSILTMGILLGIYLEVQNPGMTFPIIMGLSCLSLVLLGKFSMETIGWIEGLMLGLGLILVLLELFILPTFGLLGIVGIVLALGGFILLTLPHFESVTFFPHWNLAAEAVIEHLAWICATLVISGVIIAFLSKKMMKRFILTGEEKNESSLTTEINSIGVAFTDLSPSGKVEIADKIYDAITEGYFLEKGTEVIVLREEGSQLYVRKK
jgi:membrane-bound ClpP family serine protease